MTSVLTLLGVLTLIGTAAILLNLPPRTPSWIGTSYVVGGIAASLIWFAFARILAKLTELEGTLAKVLARAGSGQGLTTHETADVVYRLSLDYFDSAEDYVNQRIDEREEVIDVYPTLRAAIDGEWSHFLTQESKSDTPHPTTEAAQEYAARHGIRKASIYAVTREQVRVAILRLNRNWD